jgi:hypothetical protein
MATERTSSTAGKSSSTLQTAPIAASSTSSSSSLSGCTVTIDLPKGRYVGAVKDQDPIQLNAIESPPPASFGWSIASGPGSGTFATPAAQNTLFTGSIRGPLIAQVVATTPSSICSATANLVVIEINDLSETVPENQYDEITVAGQYTIAYSNGNGQLRAVLIAPISNPSDPYQWNTDFYAQVNHMTGDVTVTLIRGGPYLIKSIRDNNGTQSVEIVSLLFNAFAHYTTGQKDITGKAVSIPSPSADLILIGPDGTLDTDRSANPHYIPMTSVQDAIDSITLAQKLLGRKVSVAIIEHGGPGLQCMGDGPSPVMADGKYIRIDDPVSAIALFKQGANGKVSSIVLYGCNTAQGPTGAAFITDLANGTGASVTGYTGATTVSSYWRFGTVYEYGATDNGNTVKKP